MNKNILIVLRVALGLLFLYAGISKLMNPSWSAMGYLNSAKSFVGLFHWFAQSSVLLAVNFIVQWGEVLIGLSLMSGVLVRWASFAGALLMLLFYLPVLEFPFVDHSLLVDDHIIYGLVFLLFATLPKDYLWRLKLKRE